MRNCFADVFYDLAKADPRLCVVVADISPAGSIAKFRNEFPDRFLNTGVAEQAMIGMAAGMAQRGLRPFAYTIATFALYRPFEFIRDDLAYQNLPVTVVGVGGGVTYSTLGATHHAMEDIAIATAVPNLSVIAPCDPAEAAAATRWCAEQTGGPVYLRLGKAGEPSLTDTAAPWEFGKIRRLTGGLAPEVAGGDVAIFGYGPVLQLGFDLKERLAARGEKATIYSCHTLKPFDEAGAIAALRAHDRAIVIEETTPTGSLGRMLKALAYEHRILTPIEAFSLKDEFIHLYGPHQDLLAAHGLTVEAMERRLGV
ncbi:MAG: hypothetical protein MRY74_03445 [Neomegalonema sp.]|nr:hypothetical protein [Neomegalonema sp.]